MQTFPPLLGKKKTVLAISEIIFGRVRVKKIKILNTSCPIRS